MKIFSRKNPVILSMEPRSLARPKIHSVVAKKTTRKMKEKEVAGKEVKKKGGKKIRTSFTQALSAFFSKKKKPYSLSGAPKKTLETKILNKPSVNLPEKQIEVKIRTARSRLRFVLPLALPIGVLAIMPWTPWFSPAKAAIKLYPATCLGGWENPKNAEGAPSLPSKSSPGQFNDRNSAVLRNSLAQIFCTDFTNAFSPDVFPKKMFLKFSWATIAPAVSAAPDIPAKASAETSSALLVPAEPPAVTEASSTKEESIAPAAGTSSKKTVIDSKPVSFLEKLLNIALAESASGTPVTASTTSVEQQDGYVSAPPKEESVPQEEGPKISGADFLQVLYTLDGQNWKQLGMVTRENLADLSFQVPISDPEALSHFQVSIQNVISLDDPPVIYLDGMWLEAGE